MDDLQGLNDRISAMENRVKTSIFSEVEKKLSEFEQNVQPPGEERVQEIEDLMLLLQIENAKIKEKLGTQDIVESQPALEQRISKIEERLGQGISQNLEQRILQIESKIDSKSSGPITITGKDADAYMERMNRARIEIENSLNKLKAMRDAVENIASEKQGVMQKIQSIEIDIEKASTAFTKIKTLEEKIGADVEKMEALKDGIDAKISASSEKVDSSRKDVENRIFSVEEKFKTRMERLDAVQESIETKIGLVDGKSSEFESLRKQIDSVLLFKSNLEKESGRMGDIEKHIHGLNTRIAKFSELSAASEESSAKQASLEKHVQDLAGKVTAMHSIKGTLDESYAKSVSLEKRLQDMGYSMDRWIEDVNSRLTSVNAVRSDIEKETVRRAELENQIKDAVYSTKKMADDVNSKIASINSRLAGIDASHSDIEDTSSQVAALERKIIETGNKMTGAEARIGDIISEKILAGKKEIEARIAAVSQKSGETERRMKETENYVNTLTEKIVGELRVDIDKLVEEKSSEFSSKIKEASSSLNIEEIRKIRDETAEQQLKLNDLEGKLELAATRFFTENMEQFAMALDKKFPEFVVKKDYSRDLADVSQKLRTIQSPDLSPLAERVMLVERRLSDIYDMTKSMSNSMPIVVE